MLIEEQRTEYDNLLREEVQWRFGSVIKCA